MAQNPMGDGIVRAWTTTQSAEAFPQHWRMTQYL